jgi:hypothetical protein
VLLGGAAVVRVRRRRGDGEGEDGEGDGGGGGGGTPRRDPVQADEPSPVPAGRVKAGRGAPKEAW